MNRYATVPPFVNEPFTDFNQAENKQAMQAALAKVKAELGQEYPLHIGAEKIFTDEKIVSYNPGETSQIIGRVSKATQDLAEQAMQTALKTFETWKKVAARQRAEYLLQAAQLMRERKHEFSGLLIY